MCVIPLVIALSWRIHFVIVQFVLHRAPLSFVEEKIIETGGEFRGWYGDKGCVRMRTNNIARVKNTNQCMQRSNKNKGVTSNIKVFDDRKSKMRHTEWCRMYKCTHNSFNVFTLFGIPLMNSSLLFIRESNIMLSKLQTILFLNRRSRN